MADELDKVQGRTLRVTLPRFITDEDVGLGDAIKRVATGVGLQPCSGCDRRAAALNRWFVFAARREK